METYFQTDLVDKYEDFKTDIFLQIVWMKNDNKSEFEPRY